jgi:hypothetical protein
LAPFGWAGRSAWVEAVRAKNRFRGLDRFEPREYIEIEVAVEFAYRR